jgi:hypothetical protein
VHAGETGDLKVAVAATGLLQLLTIFLNGGCTDSFEAAGVDVEVGEKLEYRGVLALGRSESLLVVMVHTAELVGTEEEGPGHSDGGEDFKLLHLISDYLGLFFAIFTSELPSQKTVSCGYRSLSG